MEKQKKIKFMENWCKKQRLVLELNGECGLGRECVGILDEGKTAYPDYMWYDDEYERIDNNGEVWIPEKAYHKHDCVAVLGRDEASINQLYEWIKWFDENNFFYKNEVMAVNSSIEFMLGRHVHHILVKQKPGGKGGKNGI